MVGYQQRFLLLSFGRWLNRDPIEEDGGVNLYSLINNNPIAEIDCLGLAIIVIKHLPGTTPPTGWPDTDDAKCLALTVYRGPTYSVSEKKYPRGKIGFNVEVNPPNSFVDVYFRTLNDFLTKCSMKMITSRSQDDMNRPFKISRGALNQFAIVPNLHEKQKTKKSRI